jgi:hypothetical protein
MKWPAYAQTPAAAGPRATAQSLDQPMLAVGLLEGAERDLQGLDILRTWVSAGRGLHD